MNKFSHILVKSKTISYKSQVFLRFFSPLYTNPSFQITHSLIKSWSYRKMYFYGTCGTNFYQHNILCFKNISKVKILLCFYQNFLSENFFLKDHKIIDHFSVISGYYILYHLYRLICIFLLFTMISFISIRLFISLERNFDKNHKIISEM